MEDLIFMKLYLLACYLLSTELKFHASRPKGGAWTTDLFFGIAALFVY